MCAVFFIIQVAVVGIDLGRN